MATQPLRGMSGTISPVEGNTHPKRGDTIEVIFTPRGKLPEQDFLDSGMSQAYRLRLVLTADPVRVTGSVTVHTLEAHVSSAYNQAGALIPVGDLDFVVTGQINLAGQGPHSGSRVSILANRDILHDREPDTVDCE